MGTSQQQQKWSFHNFHNLLHIYNQLEIFEVLLRMFLWNYQYYLKHLFFNIWINQSKFKALPSNKIFCFLMISSHRVLCWRNLTITISFFLIWKSLIRQADCPSVFSISNSCTLHINMTISVWSSSLIFWGTVCQKN